MFMFCTGRNSVEFRREKFVRDIIYNYVIDITVATIAYIFVSFYTPITFFLFSDGNPPWANPNAPPNVPKKKFRTSINTRPVQSRTSRKAPYAPRVTTSTNAWETPKVVNGKVFTQPEYSSLEDPHLNDFFARKTGAIPKLIDKRKQVLPNA